MPILYNTPITPETAQRITDILETLSAAYPDYALSAETCRVYIGLWARLDLDWLEAAALEHIDQCKWFPKHAELMAVYHELREVRSSERWSTALEAWAKVEEAFDAVGSYQTPAFDDPLIMQAVDTVGGWVQLCRSTGGPYDRRDFIRAYDDLSRRVQRETRRLPEIADRLKALPAPGTNLKALIIRS